MENDNAKSQNARNENFTILICHFDFCLPAGRQDICILN